MRALVHQGLESGVVVAMDWGAYKYLVHRNIPATLMTTSLPLDVCCLRRFKMVPWRATNDIKVGAFPTRGSALGPCQRCASDLSPRDTVHIVSCMADAGDYPGPEDGSTCPHAGHGREPQWPRASARWTSERQ